MRIEVMYPVDCPNAVELIEYLKRRGDVDLTLTLVMMGPPIPRGFAGSPTVLVDGEDPFGSGRVEGPACALSPPTVGQLEEFFRRRANPT